jgi:HSP20 family protein
MAGGFPAMNIYSNAEGVVLTAELPGVDIKDVDIQVVGDNMTISGSRQVMLVDGASYHRQERPSGSFTRTIQLPFPVETAQVKATLQKGLLVIKLPRLAASKPKKITIRSAE